MIRPMAKAIQAFPFGSFGAVISGLNLRKLAGEEVLDFLRKALTEFQLLLFREQEISPRDQIRLTSYFGNLDLGISRRPKKHQVPGFPDLLYVSNTPGSPTLEYGAGWHSDGLAYARRPHGATVLHCIDSPPHECADTLFADQYRALSSIPQTLRTVLGGMQWYLPSIPYSEVPPGRGLIHPVVRTHPVTGRRMVYCSPQATHIRGLNEAESARHLAVVHQAQAQEALIYRHSWRPGDVLVWENATLLHNRAGEVDFAKRGLRALHRSATIGGFEATECEAAPSQL